MNLTNEDIQARLGDTAGKPIGKHRFFSVLVPFVEKDGETCLLFEVRARNMASDPGEICFPGGHVEPGEDTAQCALRETVEEVGIPREKIQLLGQGKILYGYANYTLYTYLGRIDYEEYCKAKLAEEEVEEIFLVPLSRFAKESPQVFRETVKAEISKDFPYEKLGIDENYKWRTGQWDIPIYDIDGRMIWGLTARITADLINTLKESEKESKDVFTD